MRRVLLLLVALGCWAQTASAVRCYVGVTSFVPQGTVGAILAYDIAKALPDYKTKFSAKPQVKSGFSFCWNYTTHIFPPPSGADEVHVYGGSRVADNCQDAVSYASRGSALRFLSKFGVPERPMCCKGNDCNFLDKPEPQSKYNETQFVGFSMNTFPVANTYLGNPSIESDLEARMTIMSWALETAANSTAIDWRSNVLKVFAAPEFYFRGPEGAYNATQLLEGFDVDEQYRFEFGTELTKLVSDRKWKDWLFIFGTVIAYDYNEHPNRNSSDPASKYVYFNVAPIHKGNSTTKFLEFKNYISSIDFIKDRDLKAGYVPDPAAESYYSNLPPAFQKTLMEAGYKIIENNTFMLDNLTIGIEVCLDHNVNTLGKHLLNTPSGYVDLHLITSAGMSIASGAVGVRQGGQTYLVDGNSRSETNSNNFGAGSFKYAAARYPGTFPIFDVGPVNYTTASSLQANFIKAFAYCLSTSTRQACLEADLSATLLPYADSLNGGVAASTGPVGSALAVTPVVDTSYIAKYYGMAMYDGVRAAYFQLGYDDPPTAAAPTVDIYPTQKLVKMVPLYGLA